MAFVASSTEVTLTCTSQNEIQKTHCPFWYAQYIAACLRECTHEKASSIPDPGNYIDQAEHIKEFEKGAAPKLYSVLKGIVTHSDLLQFNWFKISSDLGFSNRFFDATSSTTRVAGTEGELMLVSLKAKGKFMLYTEEWQHGYWEELWRLLLASEKLRCYCLETRERETKEREKARREREAKLESERKAAEAKRLKDEREYKLKQKYYRLTVNSFLMKTDHKWRGDALENKCTNSVGVNSKNQDYFQMKLDLVTSDTLEPEYSRPSTERDSKAKPCSQQFNLINRRHHCRLCGNIFCADCCPKFQYSTRKGPKSFEYEKKIVRLCYCCYLKVGVSIFVRGVESLRPTDTSSWVRSKQGDPQSYISSAVWRV